MNLAYKIPPHLPERLTISFPIWGIFDTNGCGCYHDLDRFVKEHKERGFNCIRLEGGAGLTHDINGNPRGEINIHAPFGEYSVTRQIFCFGGEGKCNFLERVLALCEACKKYNVYLIFSSWYFLHTYWFVDNEINSEIFSVKSEDMFMTFAKLLHYVLKEIENKGYSDRIAMAEIFNEVGCVPALIGELKNENVKHIDFKKKHNEALLWLREQHPGILFGYDNDIVSDQAIEDIPEALQAFNGHNYFLWGVYGGTLEAGEPDKSEFYSNKVKPEDVAAARGNLVQLSPTCAPWYNRVARCASLDESKFPLLEEYLTERIKERKEEYINNLDSFCEGFKKIMAKFPGIPVVSGEGVTYCSCQKLHWEEKCEEYWEIVKYAVKKYKEIGLWGTLIKTCLGPEDPSWELCKDKIKEINEMFLK